MAFPVEVTIKSMTNIRKWMRVKTTNKPWFTLKLITIERIQSQELLLSKNGNSCMIILRHNPSNTPEFMIFRSRQAISFNLDNEIIFIQGTYDKG